MIDLIKSLRQIQEAHEHLSFRQRSIYLFHQSLFLIFHSFCVSVKKKTMGIIWYKTYKVQGAPDSQNTTKCNLIHTKGFVCACLRV